MPTIHCHVQRTPGVYTWQSNRFNSPRCRSKREPRYPHKKPPGTGTGRSRHCACGQCARMARCARCELMAVLRGPYRNCAACWEWQHECRYQSPTAGAVVRRPVPLVSEGSQMKTPDTTKAVSSATRQGAKILPFNLPARTNTVKWPRKAAGAKAPMSQNTTAATANMMAAVLAGIGAPGPWPWFGYLSGLEHQLV